MKNWMRDAVKRPGALHRALHIPLGNKIPSKVLTKATHSLNPTLKKRATLAKTFNKYRP